MRILIHENYQQLSKWTAYYIANKIKAFNPFITSQSPDQLQPAAAAAR